MATHALFQFLGQVARYVPVPAGGARGFLRPETDHAATPGGECPAVNVKNARVRNREIARREFHLIGNVTSEIAAGHY